MNTRHTLALSVAAVLLAACAAVPEPPPSSTPTTQIRAGGTQHPQACGLLLTPADLAELGVTEEIHPTRSVDPPDGSAVCRFDPAKGRLPSATVAFLPGGEDKVADFKAGMRDKARAHANRDESKGPPTMAFGPDGFCARMPIPFVDAVGCTGSTDRSVVTFAVMNRKRDTPASPPDERQLRVLQRLLDRVRDGGG